MKNIILNPIFLLFIVLILGSDSVSDFIWKIGFAALIGFFIVFFNQKKRKKIVKDSLFSATVLKGEDIRFSKNTKLKEDIINSPINLSDKVVKEIEIGSSWNNETAYFFENKIILQRNLGIFSYLDFFTTKDEAFFFTDIICWSHNEKLIQMEAYFEKNGSGRLIWLSFSKDDKIVKLLKDNISDIYKEGDCCFKLPKSVEEKLIVSEETPYVNKK
jgi:hypothetical protein